MNPPYFPLIFLYMFGVYCWGHQTQADGQPLRLLITVSTTAKPWSASPLRAGKKALGEAEGVAATAFEARFSFLEETGQLPRKASLGSKK